MRVSKRKGAALFFLTAYIITWFAFGVRYWWAANRSNGGDFIFQEDIRLRWQVQEFKNLTDSPVPEALIKKLFLTDRGVLGQRYDELYRGEPIGRDWADYYDLKLMTRYDIAFFSVKIGRSNGFEYPLTLNFYPDSPALGKAPQESCTIYCLGTQEVAGTKPVLTKKIIVKDARIVQEFARLNQTGTQLIKEAEELAPGAGYVYVTLPSLLTSSLTYLDADVLTMQRIATGRFDYPLWYFLYFSAVTITTAGYGDILPNSPGVRISVMIETMLGVVLVGAFMAYMFSD